MQLRSFTLDVEQSISPPRSNANGDGVLKSKMWLCCAVWMPYFHPFWSPFQRNADASPLHAAYSFALIRQSGRSTLSFPSKFEIPAYWHPSIHLNSPIYPPHKSIRRQEPHRAHAESIDRARQGAVSEIKHTARETGDVQCVAVVVGAVDEDPEARAGAEEEGGPGPGVVLLEARH